MTANGRHARYYIHGQPGARVFLPVTYHRRSNGRLRQLTVSQRLLARVLR